MMSSGISTKRKKWWWYVPYISIFNFICEMIGLGIWDTSARAALKSTNAALQTLDVNLDTELVWGNTAVVATTVVVVLLNLCMLALGAGRGVIGAQADRTGATRMGGRLIAWLWCDAVFIFFWWWVILWMILLMLGFCIFTAGSYGLVFTLKVGLRTLKESTSLSNEIGVVVGADQTAGRGLLVGDAASLTPPSPPGPPVYFCPKTCLDLAGWDWALGQNKTCFCKLDKVEEADAMMHEAAAKYKACAAGMVILLLVATWVLMATASEFGVTRRERQLLRRIAKARAAQAAGESQGLLNGGPSSGGISGYKGIKKSKSKGSNLSQASIPQVIVDQETGEVLGVEGLQEDRPPTAPASSTARMRAAAEVEASSDSHTHHGMSYIGSRAAKSFIKGLGKTTMVFDKLGSFLK